MHIVQGLLCGLSISDKNRWIVNTENECYCKLLKSIWSKDFTDQRVRCFAEIYKN